MPIFLWSIVVNQLQTPVVDVGLANRLRRCSKAAVAISTRSSSSSFQALQIGDERPDLILAQTVIRHQCPRFHAGRIPQPVRQVLVRSPEYGSCECLPGGEMSQVGAGRPLRVGACDRMTVRAPTSRRKILLQEDALALRREVVRG